MTSLDWTLYTAGESEAPAMLVLAGGGYRIRAEHEGEPVALWLNSLGIHAAVVHYAVGEGCWPRPLLGARAALAALRSDRHLPVDSQRVGVLGSSAGGHLAGLLATDSPDMPGADPATYCGRPDAAILAYPVTEMGATFAGQTNAHTASAERLLGPDAAPELRAALSIPARVDSSVPEVFLWTTRDDERVPALHSLSLINALDGVGAAYEAHVFRSGAHGLGLALEEPAVAQWTALAERWLTDLGWVNGDAASTPEPLIGSTGRGVETAPLGRHPHPNRSRSTQ